MSFPPSGQFLHEAQIYVEPLPPTVEDAVDFLGLHNTSYHATYVGLLCKTSDGKTDAITPPDIQDLYNPEDAKHAALICEMAQRGFDLTLPDCRLYLRARTTRPDGSPYTLGTLNMMFGRDVYSSEEELPDPAAKAKIHEINVDPAILGRGIGTLLLRHGIDRIRPHLEDSDTVRLLVMSANTKAQGLYDKLGILPTGRGRTATWGKRKVQVTLQERAARLGALAERLHMFAPSR